MQKIGSIGVLGWIRMKNNSLLVERTHSMGAFLRLLLLTLQLEIELFLALDYRKRSQNIRK